MKLSANHTIQCRCGQLKGTLAAGSDYTRAVCYCRDCQAYAEALGDAAGTLDAQGGTDIVASLQRQVRFTDGIDKLACLSLTERGLLRWYASCCNTPIGNTPRDPKLSYVGLVHTALGRDARSLDSTVGPPRLSTNVDKARGTVSSSSSGLRTLTETLRIIARLMRARFSGAWRQTPFFDAELRPIASPRVLRSSAG
jgi:Family of unknown function (DUF6151)